MPSAASILTGATCSRAREICFTGAAEAAMQVFLIVAPVFALIAIGYAASLSGLLSEAAHKGISEFAFSIAMPALLFRSIAVAEVPAVDPLHLWGASLGAVAISW